MEIRDFIVAATADDRRRQLAESLPQGSGYDGAEISVEDGGIVVSISYHHMDESGMYCGWSNHRIWLGRSKRDGEITIEHDSDYSGVDWAPDYADDDGCEAVGIDPDEEPTEDQALALAATQRTGREEDADEAILDGVAAAIQDI